MGVWVGVAVGFASSSDTAVDVGDGNVVGSLSPSCAQAVRERASSPMSSKTGFDKAALRQVHAVTAISDDAMIWIGNQRTHLSGCTPITRAIFGKWSGASVEYPGTGAGIAGLVRRHRIEEEVNVHPWQRLGVTESLVAHHVTITVEADPRDLNRILRHRCRRWW